MNENNTPQTLSEENLDLIFNALKYCINNPIILAGASICGLVMSTCIILNNKNN